MVTDVWIVLVEDRRADVEAVPFTTEEAAVAAAREAAGSDATEDGLNADMLRDGWVLCLTYSVEGDCVRVVKRTAGDTARLR